MTTLLFLLFGSIDRDLPRVDHALERAIAAQRAELEAEEVAEQIRVWMRGKEAEGIWRQCKGQVW